MTLSNPERRRCMATRKDGERCQAWADASGLCGMHGPNAHQLHVLGGRSRAKHHMLETRMNPKLKDVVELLGMAAKQVHRGEITPAQGSSLASIATALIKAVESAELTLRLSILEMRVNSGGSESDDFGT